MTNLWIEHIKKYAKDNNLSYGCALSNPECKNSYVKGSSTPKTKIKKKPECKTDCESCETCKVNKEPHKMYDKPIGPIKPKEINKMYDRPVGPIENIKYPINIVKINPNTITGLEPGHAGKSKQSGYYKRMIKQARFTHGDKVAKKLENFLEENYKHNFDNFYFVADKKPYQKYDEPIGPKKPK